ncbi:MAG TPA: HDOD domain-containing protein, partial [Myxococcota bacterium]
DAALADLAVEPVDVVVSDMRMPTCDGAELLRRVAQGHPETIRIILSGQTSEDAALRAAPVAHRFLSKPCSPELLVDAIGRLTAQKQRYSGTLARLVGQVQALPAPPTLFVTLDALMADPAAGVGDVTALIKSAPLVAAKLLQLVNSSFFLASQTITSVDAAISRLGLRLVRAVVVSEGVFSTMRTHADLVEAARRHGAVAMELAARIAPAQLRDASVTAALLARIGLPLLATVAPEHLDEIRAAVDAGAHPAVIERFTIGATCDALAAHVLSMWNLPAEVVDAVAMHRHEPAAWDVRGIVAVAARLADGLPVDIEGLRSIGAPAAAIDALLQVRAVA